MFALALFTGYLTLRARASFNIIRAAYPTEHIEFRQIWGAYFAGYGFNAVIPARGGDVVRLFLTKTSVPRSSYPAVAATFVVELGFDIAMGSLILIFAFTQGVFPKPPDFAKLNASTSPTSRNIRASRSSCSRSSPWAAWWRSRC